MSTSTNDPLPDGPAPADAGGAAVSSAELASALSDIARRLENAADLDETLQGMVDAAQAAVPGAQHVSISSVRGRREVVTRAATGDLPRAVDQAQYETGEGPCLDALYHRRTARIRRMTDEGDWPTFAARAAALGVASMLAVQLYVVGEDLGVLNLFSDEPDAFTEQSERIALLFAAHAAIAMAGAEQQQNLRSAIEFRDLIGQAKGILMERFKVESQEAFQILVRTSRASNRKLHDVARELTESGTVGDAQLRPQPRDRPGT